MPYAGIAVDRVVLAGVVALRWAALVWMAIVLVVTRDDLLRPWLAALLVGAALIFTVVTTGWVRRARQMLGRPAVLVVDVAIACALVLGDGFAYDEGHAFAGSQSLASVWPVAAVLSVGVTLGVAGGVAVGALFGVARLGSVLANGVTDLSGEQVLSLLNTAAFYVVAGVVAAFVTGLLRSAEQQISAARARQEVAGRLHDGVLQTLAIVQRRSTDEDLVRLAREQDRDLRRFLFDGHEGTDDDDVLVGLRRVADRFEDAFGLRAEVLAPFPLPTLRPAEIRALTRAVGEALSNAGKHAHASRITVFVEPDDDGRVFCSIKDDGAGFDTATTAAGVGISHSIVDAMRDVGGRAQVRSNCGHGTEVCLWL